MSSVNHTRYLLAGSSVLTLGAVCAVALHSFLGAGANDEALQPTAALKQSPVTEEQQIQPDRGSALGQMPTDALRGHTVESLTFTDGDSLAATADAAQRQRQHNQDGRGSAAVVEPLLSVNNGAIEIVIPEAVAGANTAPHARIPAALWLASTAADLPQGMQNEVRQLAADFVETMAEGPVVASASDPAYHSHWQNAARQSDQAFKMRYGKVAYVQMNLLASQEAAQGSR